MTRGVAPEVVAEDRFTSLEAAEHAWIRERLDDLDTPDYARVDSIYAELAHRLPVAPASTQTP